MNFEDPSGESLKSVWNNIKTGVSNASAVKNTVSNAWNAVKATATNAWNSITQPKPQTQPLKPVGQQNISTGGGNGGSSGGATVVSAVYGGSSSYSGYTYSNYGPVQAAGGYLNSLPTNTLLAAQKDPKVSYGSTSSYNRQGAIDYACEWAGDTDSSGVFSSVIDFIVNGPNRNPDYYNYTTNCANFVSQCLVAGGLEMTDEWHQYKSPKSSFDLRSLLPVVGQNYKYDWDTGSIVKKDENGNETLVQPWSEAQAQYEYFIGDNEPIIIENENDVPSNTAAIKEAISKNNIMPGDLLYFGELDANGMPEIHHANNHYKCI